MPGNNLKAEYSAHPTAATTRWQRIRTIGTGSVALGLFAIGILVAGIAWLSASRHYFGYGTESDFLGSFLGEAIAFLHGQPLEVQYQPPLYSICIALLHMFTGDWFTAGRVLSLFSAFTVLVTSFFFYRFSLSKTAAWGAITALAISPIFISYSAYATSDVFFLALYSTVLLLAYLGERRSSIVLWCATGIFLALALLTRANALTLIMVAAVPLLSQKQTWRSRISYFSSLIAGVSIPLLTWGAYASISNSNLWPAEGTTINLALSYFRPHKGADWGSSIEFAKSNFSSVWDVLTYDPIFLVKSYLKDLHHVVEKILWPNVIFAFPATCFVLPAVLYFFLVKQPRWMYYILVLSTAQVLLVNFKTYNSRYYLFLVPLFGALVAEFVRGVYWSRRDYYWAPRELVVIPILAILLTIGLTQSGLDASASVHKDEPELSESVPVARKVISSDSIVVARKPVLGYYTGADSAQMPQGGRLKDLLTYVGNLMSAKKTHADNLYIYYGEPERRLRPEYRTLLNVSSVKHAFPQLQLVAQGSGGDQKPWVLYRYSKTSHKR